MITRKNEFLAQDVTVAHIIEFDSADWVDPPPPIGERVVHRESTLWGITSDSDCTDDYHSGLVRVVPKYQSNYLGGEVSQEEEMVWNERAVSIGIAQELAIVAEALHLETFVEGAELRDLVVNTGLRREFIESNGTDSIAEAIVAIALGLNVVLDDPEELMRFNMSNGNVVGFLDEDDEAGGAMIISSYNIPCTNPGKRLHEIFPTLVLTPLMRDGFARKVMELLGPYRGWVGGVFAPGHVSIGDKVFVNVAPTTPPLPEH